MASGRGPGEIAYACAGVYTCVVGGDGSYPHVVKLPQRGFALSPDGTRAAYASVLGGRGSNLGRVWESSSDGTGMHVVWEFVGEPQGLPAWNRAGTQLAITVKGVVPYSDSPAPGATPAGLWVLDAGGGHPHRVAADVSGDVAWNPDGATLAYQTTSSPPQLETISASGGQAKHLSSSAGSLSWSPDGHTILVTSNGGRPGVSEIEAVPAGGGTAKVVVRRSPTTAYDGAYYSPDGSQIVVGVEEFGPEQSRRSTSLSVAGTDGSHLTPLGVADVEYVIDWVERSSRLTGPPAPTTTVPPGGLHINFPPLTPRP
ncbi:MAG: hypothetical protein M3Y91_18255 [Actinomycetota bacterium]|nr:hypothetical protein [Actinomycetota bacterium]